MLTYVIGFVSFINCTLNFAFLACIFCFHPVNYIRDQSVIHSAHIVTVFIVQSVAIFTVSYFFSTRDSCTVCSVFRHQVRRPLHSAQQCQDLVQGCCHWCFPTIRRFHPVTLLNRYYLNYSHLFVILEEGPNYQ
jgi:hypothetical protein